jgi:probable phosphoglycerate mutase
MSALRRVYLVRHGEAAARWGEDADPGLSPIGRRQAAEAAEKLLGCLGGETPRIVSSPLLRAQETAGPLASALGACVQVDERFREIPAPVPLARRQSWLRAFMRGRWSEQEATLHAWRSSILEGVESLPDNAVVFSHFLVLNTIAGWQKQCDETLCFWPANASVTVLTHSGAEGWSITLGEQMQSRVN